MEVRSVSGPHTCFSAPQGTRRPRAAAALPPTAHRHLRLPRLRRRADSAVVQAAQVAPAKRTLERRRRLERWQQPSLRTNVRLPP